MPKKKKKAVVPRLRFPEFRDAGEWEVKRLGEVSEILDNMRKPISRTKRKQGTYPYYGASGAIDYIDEYIFDERLLLIGEDGAKWGPFEKTAFIVEGKYWVNNHAHVLRPVASNDVLLENYLNVTDVSVYVTGAAPPKLTLHNLTSIRIPVPPVQNEQQKIADCLTSLDDLIRAVEAQLVALKDHKKGLMQQLFPREGETTPRLRFPEFRDAGEWEVKRLGEVCEINNGSFNAKDHVAAGKYPLFDRSLTVKKSNSYIFDCEAVIIPGEGSEFSPRYYKGKFSLHQRAYALTQFNVEGKFIFFLMDRRKSQLVKQAVKSTVMSLRMPILENFTINVPRKPEQQKIADCLTSIDDLIRAGEAQLVALKDHKKGLMQQLFPQEVG